jgi:hypothetical protein
MDEFLLGDEVLELCVCKHLFHWTCAKEWLIMKNECPMDRIGVRRNLIEGLRGKPKEWKLVQQGPEDFQHVEWDGQYLQGVELGAGDGPGIE